MTRPSRLHQYIVLFSTRKSPPPLSNQTPSRHVSSVPQLVKIVTLVQTSRHCADWTTELWQGELSEFTGPQSTRRRCHATSPADVWVLLCHDLDESGQCTCRW